MATKLKIFYAWQSDTPGKLNLCFIRQAWEEAIRKLNANAQIQEDPFELGHDTKGVPGSHRTKVGELFRRTWVEGSRWWAGVQRSITRRSTLKGRV